MSIIPLSPSVELHPCVREVDGEFIRAQSRANFFEVTSRTSGWDEARHESQPDDPATYRMVFIDGRRAGFFCLREQPDCLYLSTIQLLPESRGRGIGTLLLRHVESVAGEAGAPCVRLQVFEGNRALNLYTRLGYRVVGRTEAGRILEKAAAAR